MGFASWQVLHHSFHHRRGPTHQVVSRAEPVSPDTQAGPNGGGDRSASQAQHRDTADVDRVAQGCSAWGRCRSCHCRSAVLVVDHMMLVEN